MPLEIKARLLKQFYRVGSIHVVTVIEHVDLSVESKAKEQNSALHTEPKVELPRRGLWWKVAILVRERDADLNDLEKVDIAAHCLVVVVGRSLEVSYWARYNTRKLGILKL